MTADPLLSRSSRSSSVEAVSIFLPERARDVAPISLDDASHSPAGNSRRSSSSEEFSVLELNRCQLALAAGRPRRQGCFNMTSDPTSFERKKTSQPLSDEAKGETGQGHGGHCHCDETPLELCARCDAANNLEQKEASTDRGNADQEQYQQTLAM